MEDDYNNTETYLRKLICPMKGWAQKTSPKAPDITRLVSVYMDHPRNQSQYPYKGGVTIAESQHVRG